MDALALPSAACHPDLRGRCVFVTGGASGIGAAVVEAFARQGATVAFVDIAETKAGALTQRLADDGCTRPWWRHCDVRDVAVLQHAITDATAELGGLDVLVNSAGHHELPALADITPGDWDRHFAVNQRAAFFAIQAAIPGMRELGGGAIVNIAWNSGYPVPAGSGSLRQDWIRALARELGADRIRINTVVAGPMAQRPSPGNAGERKPPHQCLPDAVLPADVAAMALFLASPAGRACTGQEYVVGSGAC